MLLGLPLLAAVTLASQSQDPPPPPAPASRVLATRAAQPPVIDGRDDDAVWRGAPPVTGFPEWRAPEGGAAHIPTPGKNAQRAAHKYFLRPALRSPPPRPITGPAPRRF